MAGVGISKVFRLTLVFPWRLKIVTVNQKPKSDADITSPRTSRLILDSDTKMLTRPLHVSRPQIHDFGGVRVSQAFSAPPFSNKGTAHRVRIATFWSHRNTSRTVDSVRVAEHKVSTLEIAVLRTAQAAM